MFSICFNLEIFTNSKIEIWVYSTVKIHKNAEFNQFDLSGEETFF